MPGVSIFKVKKKVFRISNLSRSKEAWEWLAWESGSFVGGGPQYNALSGPTQLSLQRGSHLLQF